VSDPSPTEPPRPASPRPPFAAGYPDDARLDRALELLRVGNYRAMRALVEPLTLGDGEPAVAAAARDLVRRISPDPIAFVLLGVTALLLLTLTLWSLHESKAERDGPRAPRAAASAP
jgi:hypothetical protein